jgi:para-nitrobenzyl esterase
LIQTVAGAVRGRRDGEISVFHGVPYAVAPVGERRFAPPASSAPWTGVREAGGPAPAAPQPPSRLEQVVGPMRFAQSEDCLTLDIWTPDVRGRAPVLVWLHGGAYTSGSGGQDWYAARSLAERGLVVVNVTYRLGALGFLYLAEFADDLGAGNFGLLDQLAALRWVREGIEVFGGDPGQVTVAGQSAGALSALALSAGPNPRERLYRRLILQSTPDSVVPASTGDASRVTELFLEEVGLEPGRARLLRTLPVARLLDAQVRVAARTARFMDITPPFQLVADGESVAADLLGGCPRTGRHRAADRDDPGRDQRVVRARSPGPVPRGRGRRAGRPRLVRRGRARDLRTPCRVPAGCDTRAGARRHR